MKKQSLALWFLVSLSLHQPAHAQLTVGDATRTPVTPSSKENYGVTSPLSTHQRLGNSTGIGGSYLGTESVTSESRARVSRQAWGAAAPTVHEVRLQIPKSIEMSSTSPSLSGPKLQSIDAQLWQSPTYQLNSQSNPDYSFSKQRSPALQGVRMGGSSYSLGDLSGGLR